MLELVQYLFNDFWRFLMALVLLVIFVQWRPVNVVIVRRMQSDEDDN